MRVRFKRAWKDGTHAVSLDFISRLCALIPPPRFTCCGRCVRRPFERPRRGRPAARRHRARRRSSAVSIRARRRCSPAAAATTVASSVGVAAVGVAAAPRVRCRCYHVSRVWRWMKLVTIATDPDDTLRRQLASDPSAPRCEWRRRIRTCTRGGVADHTSPTYHCPDSSRSRRRRSPIRRPVLRK